MKKIILLTIALTACGHVDGFAADNDDTDSDAAESDPDAGPGDVIDCEVICKMIMDCVVATTGHEPSETWPDCINHCDDLVDNDQADRLWYDCASPWEAGQIDCAAVAALGCL